MLPKVSLAPVKKFVCTNSEITICTTHGVIETTNGIRSMWNLDIVVPRTSTTYMIMIFMILNTWANYLPHTVTLKIIIFLMWYNVIWVVKSNTTFKIILELLLFIVIYYTRATVKYIIKHSYNVYVSSLYIIM